MAVRVVLLVLAVLAFVPAVFVIRDRAYSPDGGGFFAGLLPASPFLVLGTLLAVSALLMERRR